MELLLEEGSIAKRIKELKPTRIATAYIGRNWSSYVDASDIESIVLSPTLGSSCAGIWDLVEALGGFDRVFFLRELHAKFYLSAMGAVLGSSNLSDNGLQGEGGLIEAAVAMNPKEHAAQCAKLESMHRTLVARAKKQYPDEQSKRHRLDWLQQLQQRSSLVPDFPGIGNPVAKTQIKGRALQDFDPGLKQLRIHIKGWSYEMEHDDEGLRGQFEGDPSSVLRHARDNYISLASKNDMKPGDWVLCWQAKETGWEPLDEGMVYWLHVDRVCQTTGNHEDYEPFVAFEARKMRPDEVPFLLSAKVKSAVRKLLVSGEFPAICNPEEPDDEGFTMKAADKQVPGFIRALKEAVS